jgi:GxxExxY protein
MEKIIYPELSHKIMGCVFEVHKTLGPGFTENIYEEALTYELSRRNIPFKRQETLEVTYKNQVVGLQRLDIIIDDKIILELKSVSELNDLFKQQLLSYLRSSAMKLGILINFGTSRVQYTRIVNNS